MARTQDRALLDAVSRFPCLACPEPTRDQFAWIVANLRDAPVVSDPDHITTRGSGGGDEPANVWPLCREHHSERHNQGILHMTESYPRCKAWLEKMERWDILERRGIKKLERYGEF